jgi:hypothetical protein
MRDLPRIHRPIVGMQYFLPLLLVLIIIIATITYLIIR